MRLNCTGSHNTEGLEEDATSAEQSGQSRKTKKIDDLVKGVHLDK